MASPASQIRLIAAGLSIQDECATREATDGAPFTRNDAHRQKLSFQRRHVCQPPPLFPLSLSPGLAAYGIPLQLDAPVSLRFSAPIFLSRAPGRGSRSTIATRSIHNDQPPLLLPAPTRLPVPEKLDEFALTPIVIRPDRSSRGLLHGIRSSRRASS